MPPNYLHARLKCCNDSFASYPQYIFQTLDWIERNVAGMVHFTERKFQTDVTMGRVMWCVRSLTTKFLHILKWYKEHLDVFVICFMTSLQK